MATQRKPHPVARLLEALETENIRFMLIGMSAAIVQGVMETTLDVDFWIDLPPRQYMRVQNVARAAGCTVAANTVVYARDGTPVNFVFEVHGLGAFKRELKHAEKISFRGKKIPVLKLERILKSKEAIRRDKDLPHIIQIRELLRCRRALQPKTAKAAK
jgi:predicted nucleotidyltransferase